MTDANKMNDGVALLLDRMKTNPEEFVPINGSSKWGSLIASYKDFLEPKDRQAIHEGMNKLLQQVFTERVMQELIDPDDEYVNIPAQRIRRAKRFAGEITVTSTCDTPIAGVTQTI